MKCPCNKCENRQELCHSKCEAYRDYRKKVVDMNKAKFMETQKNSLSASGSRSRHKRNDRSIFKTHKR